MSKYEPLGFEGRAKLTEIFNAVRADQYSAPSHFKVMTELLRAHGHKHIESYIDILKTEEKRDAV